jgi:hypothetical protein
MLTEIPEARKTYTGKTMRQAMENWIRRHSPVSPETDGRWVRDDNSAISPELEAALRRQGATP